MIKYYSSATAMSDGREASAAAINNGIEANAIEIHVLKINKAGKVRQKICFI